MFKISSKQVLYNREVKSLTASWYQLFLRDRNMSGSASCFDKSRLTCLELLKVTSAHVKKMSLFH